MFLLLLLCIDSVLSTRHPTRAPTEEPPYCYLNTGCASAYNCQCPSTFTYCNLEDDPDGVCRFTTAGIFALLGICAGSIVAIIIIICCLCCCCCHRGSDNHHTTVHYHATPYNHHEIL